MSTERRENIDAGGAKNAPEAATGPIRGHPNKKSLSFVAGSKCKHTCCDSQHLMGRGLVDKEIRFALDRRVGAEPNLAVARRQLALVLSASRTPLDRCNTGHFGRLFVDKY